MWPSLTTPTAHAAIQPTHRVRPSTAPRRHRASRAKQPALYKSLAPEEARLRASRGLLSIGYLTDLNEFFSKATIVLQTAVVV